MKDIRKDITLSNVSLPIRQYLASYDFLFGKIKNFSMNHSTLDIIKRHMKSNAFIYLENYKDNEELNLSKRNPQILFFFFECTSKLLSLLNYVPQADLRLTCHRAFALHVPYLCVLRSFFTRLTCLIYTPCAPYLCVLKSFKDGLVVHQKFPFSKDY